MKRSFILLAILPLTFLAASFRHMAFGLVHFGMTEAETNKALTVMLNTPAQRKKEAAGFAMADLRSHFVNTGTKSPLTLAPADASAVIGFAHNGKPLITSFSFERWEPTMDGARHTWSLFREISDAKFDRDGLKTEFPTFEEIKASGLTGIVTDKWKCEGLEIELRVEYIDGSNLGTANLKVPPNDGYFIEPRLTAKEPEVK